MNKRTVDIASVVSLIIVLNIVIADDGVMVKSDILRDDVDIHDESDYDTVCASLATDPSPCPCQCINSSLICCNLEGPYPLPPDLCGSYTCPATEITLINFHLHSTAINRQFILSLGWQHRDPWTLRLRNCSISDTQFGEGLDGLLVLDLRGNEVEAFKEPEIQMLESIYLSGNNWPCIDPAQEKKMRSKSSLRFGEEMSWLLEEDWDERWIDKKLTFCNLDDHDKNVEEQLVLKHSVESFLQFTKKTSSTCPELCDCEVADETIKFSQEHLSRYKVNVVCTDLGLTSLPQHLPPDTIFLNMANNQVASLDLLSDLYPDYKSIERLILSNNSLKSLEGLEKSWLQRTGPVLLDVRDNFIMQLDTSALEPMLSKASINTESNYFFSGNPWSCNCQNIKTIQEFLEKYSSLIMDTEHMRCSDCECTLLHLDYKEMCTKDHDYMIWVILVEAILLVVIMLKFTWDCIRYRRTGHLPWVARHLCWSVPGISRGRWTPCLPGICAQGEDEGENLDQPDQGVGKGSSGYLTCSGSSQSSKSARTHRACPGGKESSVVRFL